MLKWYNVCIRTWLGIYGKIYPSAFRSSLRLRSQELLQAMGYIWPYIPPLILIRIQYTLWAVQFKGIDISFNIIFVQRDKSVNIIFSQRYISVNIIFNQRGIPVNIMLPYKKKITVKILWDFRKYKKNRTHWKLPSHANLHYPVI